MQHLLAQLENLDVDWVRVAFIAIVILFSAAGGLANWLKERAKKSAQGRSTDAEADYEVVIGPDGEPVLRPIQKSAPPPPPRRGMETTPVPPLRSDTPATPPDKGVLRPRSFPQTPVAKPITPRPPAPPPVPVPAPARARAPERAKTRREEPVEAEPGAPRARVSSSEARLHDDEHVTHPPAARLHWFGPQGADRETVRRAFVLSEILGRPIAMRDPHVQP